MNNVVENEKEKFNIFGEISNGSTTHSTSTSSSSSDVYLSTGWPTFTTSFITNIVIGSVIMIIFFFLRIIYRNFYNARLIKSNGLNSVLITSPFQWIIYTISYQMESIFESRGIDAYMHLQFLYLCIQILSIIMVFGIGILLPINYTSITEETANVVLNTLDTVTVGTIQPNSKRLWAHTLSIPIFTMVAFYFFQKTNTIYLEKRIRWMSKHNERNYTVLVREMSRSISNADDMREFFSRFFDSKAILSCHIIYKEAKLRSLWRKHKHVQRSLERVLSESDIKGVPPTRAVGWRPGMFGGKTVDSVEYFTKKLEQVDKELRIAQEEASIKKDLSISQDLAWRVSNITASNIKKLTNMTSTAGFITFSRMAFASQAAQCLFSKNIEKFKVTPAPEIKNIKWKNMIVPNRSRFLRRIVSSIIFFVIFCFYTIPVTAISAVSNIQTLSKVPVLNWLLEVVNLDDTLRGFVEGYLPSLALVLFLALLPLFIKIIIHFNKEDTRTQFYHKVFTVYWAFLVTNVFLVVSIAGTVLGILFKMLENLTLKDIATLLGQSLPKQSSFFINYILVQALTSVPMDIVRPIELIAGIIRSSRESSFGQKMKALSHDDPTSLNSIKYARELLIFVITLSYSTLSPLILPFGLLYFLMDFFVSKYNHIYSFCPKYQSGGMIWPLVFNRLCIGLVIYQLTGIGLFVLKTFIPGIVISFLMPFFTLFYWWRNVDKYKKPSSVLSLDICPEEDYFGNEFVKSYEDPVLSIADLEINNNFKNDHNFNHHNLINKV
ncbi:hypothetical protein DDB_G0282971 [Dictyostelium discoideum AX4]|uniref:CSC1/OSCA1-like 7TM region domain-containing protein n=1 Tax=Dictyostelium discoideum TaxID=44689 RepID=Q54RR3_DICDI|nr:hypothetical protein DDB_G0282971 [Dictyostelium discoideum AX4]EAL65929.1 hypothetical protein DDB_G0282971 [Dictyostelium discoideum AX4]|eukprot:XP_639288.1 hypothetical protein DDB_G0282971 [Dictyostelium discoideum AX4]